MSTHCTSDWCLGASFFIYLNFLLLVELGVEFVIILVELAHFQINVHVCLPSVSLQVAVWDEVCQG